MVIAGAGPAGAALALLLARQGVTITLVEASPNSARQFRGEALMPSGLAALAAMGLLPLDGTIHQRPLRGWAFWANGRLLFQVAEPMGSGHPCTLIDQEALLIWLQEQVRLQPTARVIKGRPIVAPLRDGERVVGVELDDGTQVRGELVVACDGRASLLRQKSALALRPLGEPLDVRWFRLSSAAAEPVADWLQGQFVTVLGGGDSFALYASVYGGVQLGWLQDPAGTAPATSADWRERWALASPSELAQRLRAVPLAAIQGPVRLPVQVGRLESWWRPGLLLLGDAAHPMSPLRAQGINMALRDALVAARKLLPVLSQGDPEALDRVLAAISDERLQEIRPIQADQAREVGRADLLRHNPWLLHLLTASASWSGPLLAQRWQASQVLLRQGSATADLTLPDAAMMG
ncbi:MAG: FAD-dependent monooxygenase [Synechococcaceae cyanobacterium ELA739]